MEVREGHGDSYAWKSILKGRGVIRREAKRRVGNDESIKIWGDNWLPTINNLRVHNPFEGRFPRCCCKYSN